MELCNFDECFKCVRILFVLFVSLACAQSSQPDSNEIASDPGQVGKENGDFNSTLIRHKRGNTPEFVNIAQFIDRSGPGKAHDVYVDDTMTRMLFTVAVKNGVPVFTVYKPDGQRYPGKPSIKGSPLNGTVIATLDVPISSSDYGFWTLTKVDAAIWDVTIKGKSPLYIKQNFYEKGSSSPIVAAPVIGNYYTLEVEVLGFPRVKTVDNYLLFTTSKLSPLAMNPLVQKAGNNFEAVSFRMPDKPFIVGIQGNDKSGHYYRRIDPTEIIPVTLSLDVPPYTDATVFEHSLFNITFVVTNLLSTKQDVDILVSDTRGFAQYPKTLSRNLKVGENFTGTFVIESTYAGLTTMVKIWTRQLLGNGTFREGPMERRNITVVKNETTTTSTSTPTSTGINSTGVSFSTAKSTTRLSQTTSTSNNSTTAGYTAKSANVYSHSNSSTTAQAVDLGKTTGLTPGQISGTSASLTSSQNRNSSQHGSVPKGFTVKVMSGSVTVSTDTQTAHNKEPDNPDKAGNTGHKSESEHSSMKIELSAGVIIASMVTGTVVGVVAIVTLAVIFKKALTIKNKRVAPEDESKVPERSTTPSSEHRKRSVLFY